MADPPQITPLGREECLDLLSRTPVGRVALNIGALPAIRTVRFALSAGHVVFRVAPGSTLSRAAAGILAFQADHFDSAGHEGWSVEVVGRSEAVSHPVTLAELASLPLETWTGPGSLDHFFRLALDSVSGQRVRWPS